MSWSRVVRVAATGLVLAGLSACGAAGGDFPQPSPPPSGPVASAPVVQRPPDGVPLASFGYSHGPVAEFYLPTTTVLSAAVDQDNNVTAVFARPSTAEAYAFFRRSLEPAGYTIRKANDARTTLTFSGHGWSGSFTGDTATCAILLRPER